MSLSSIALLVAMPISHAVAQSYGLFRSHSGASFFDGLEFVSGYDNTTTGNVNYTYGVGQLASVTAQGTARLAVDTGVVPVGGLRGSVKVRTLEAYGLGNVFVLDANHMPYGCSVWPAFYTVADQSRWKWPNGGEFDILETQNRGTFNQMSSHVAAPDNNTHCTMPATTAVNSDQTGLNCDAWSNYNAGCAYWDSRPTALGPGFNAGGGGVWAMTFDATGSNMWFFPRAQVPADLAAGSQSVTPSNWGQPTAAFPFGRNCDVGLYGDQQLIITTTLCGQWAGLQQVFSQSCTAPRGGNCSSLVYGDGSTTYAQAYWDINSLRVFSATAAGNVTNTPVSSSSAAPSSTVAPSGAASSQIGLPATTAVVVAAKSGSVLARTIAPLAAIAAGALAVMTLA